MDHNIVLGIFSIFLTKKIAVEAADVVASCEQVDWVLEMAVTVAVVDAKIFQALPLLCWRTPLVKAWDQVLRLRRCK
ncbi:hypothetical protein TorRG33x02_249700 [Trema orientale]|uniref:Uncharacterized protein n=1 Tax=Trema orientale TaxID=63057 RepID=A0A2P5DJL8_TREOI|nr:hypothetical protein TorRG33x02_249700 [Trema orientale]